MKKAHSSTTPRLEMRHLLMVAAIARSGNLTRAAEELSVTPSALSHRLAEAERRIGTALFLRDGRHLTATPAGLTILRAADPALAALALAEADVARLHGGPFERALRLTVGHYGLYGWFPEFYASWRAQRSGVHVYVRADAQRDPLAALRGGAVDVALLPYRPRAAPDLAAAAMFVDELVLVCPPGDPLAGKAHVEADDLAGREFLTYTRVVVPDQEYERFLRPAAARIRRFTDMESPAVIMALIARGIGVSILSRWALGQVMGEARLPALPITAGGLAVRWHAAFRAAARPDDQIDALVAALAAFPWRAAPEPGRRISAGAGIDSAL